MYKYQGAGLLIWTMHDKPCLLLIHRKANPFRATWSIFGGKVEASDRNDFRRGACRETAEELFGDHSPQNYIQLFERLSPYLSEDSDRLPLESTISLPSFTYKVYGLQLSRMPDRDEFPIFASEYDGIGWFRIDRLPHPLHPFMRRHIRRLVRI